MNFAEKMCQAAEEGGVLLKNDKAMLPFCTDDKVAVFGRCQFDYYRSGTGSGGSVHVSYSTNLTDSLIEISEKEKAPAIDRELAQIYRNWIELNPFDNGDGGWASEPWCQKEMPLSAEIIADAAKNCGKTVLTLICDTRELILCKHGPL